MCSLCEYTWQKIYSFSALCFFPSPTISTSCLFLVHLYALLYLSYDQVFVCCLCALNPSFRNLDKTISLCYTRWITTIEIGILWDVNTLSRSQITICSLHRWVITWSNEVLTEKKYILWQMIQCWSICWSESEAVKMWWITWVSLGALILHC